MKTIYKLVLKPVNEIIDGYYKVGVPEWEPYAVKAGNIFHVKKMEGNIEIVFAHGEVLHIPINEHFFTAYRVVAKTTYKTEKIWA